MKVFVPRVNYDRRDTKAPQWKSEAQLISLMHYLAPDRNSFIMDSLSFCGMSPCMEDTVKLASLIFSVSQSTYIE